MKMFSVIAVLAVSFAAADSHATSKICFGSTKNDDTKGTIILAQVTVDQLVLTDVKGESYVAGTYPALHESSKARSGKIYDLYDKESVDGYGESILVDESLKNVGGMGLIQVRARGEGFFNAVYFCKDPK